MELLAAEQAEVKQKHRQRSLRAAAALGLFWATIVLYAAGADEQSGTWFGLSAALWAPLIAAGTLAGLIGFAVSLRCPNCSKSYGRPWISKFCGSCGVELK